ncbi:MAG: hypothetical protein J7K72_04395 [Candidatus Aenigmarchaeota archaeon]|nr:hypothetical protein [Candidatus Aenigmarchaeota archaeon]
MYERVAEQIVTHHLHIRKNERFFIITDSINTLAGRVARVCYDMARSMGIASEIVVQRKISFGTPDKKVVAMAKRLRKNDCILISLDGKIGNFYGVLGRSFRAFLRAKGTRFVNMSGLENMKTGKILSDRLCNKNLEEVEKTGKMLKTIMDNGKELKIFGASGTVLTSSIERRRSWLNTGEYHRPGTGGKIPAGNVNVFPVENSINGEVVLDVSVKVEAETIPLKDFVTFRVENGEIVEISGNNEIVERMYNDLNNFSFINARSGMNPRCIFRISEIGFGLLDGYPIGMTIFDSVLMNICHVSNGNNFGKGGRNRCRGQRDHLFWLKAFEVDGEKFTMKKIRQRCAL